MGYQTDYILRLVEQISNLVKGTMERLGVEIEGEREDLAAQAIGLVLDMDPKMASELPPETLRTMLALVAVDGRVLGALGEAIEMEATTLESEGLTESAAARRRQAAAVRSLL